MLYDPSAHEALADVPWDEARVRAAVREIVADADVGYDAGAGSWPLHPRDAGQGDDDHAAVSHGVYMGAAGMLWGLDRLARAGAAHSSIHLREAAVGLHAGYLANCCAPEEPMPSLWVGESGIYLVADAIDPGERSSARAAALLDAVHANAHNATLELLWGGAGTMVAAREMHRRTGGEQWAGAWRASADALLSEWRFDEQLGCHLWTQLIYGKAGPGLGPGHGFAGNIFALLDGIDLLPRSTRDEVVERATRTVLATAVTADGLANWPVAAGAAIEWHDGARTQWCHGAPGIVATLASLPADPDLDAILAAGGELTWRAGPLVKGAGLCHGTAGNGLAFLALFARTGDELWLARARAFAMHSLAQVDSQRKEHKQPRYGLWTGDLGTALYAWQCIDGDPALPALTAW